MNGGFPVVGLVSDTHGEFDTRIADAFSDVAHIIHAGDFGSEGVLDELRALAPMTFVRGNTDHTPYGRDREVIDVAGVAFVVVHHKADLYLKPPPPNAAVAVYGHTHVPHVEWHGAILYVNPGSPARPRAGHGPSVARVTLTPEGPEARILYL